MYVRRTGELDTALILRGWIEDGEREMASMPEAERKAVEARMRRRDAEILVTTSTGNEIKAGK